MAPEQARGHHDSVDGRTDQFALGAIAFRMLTGRDPFEGESPAALLYQVVHEDPPPLATLMPSGWDPRPLQEVLNRALAKRPEDRWGGMMEFARAFEAAAERTLPGEDGALASRPEPEVLDTPPPVRLRLVSPAAQGTPWSTPSTGSSEVDVDARRGKTNSGRPSPSGSSELDAPAPARATGLVRRLPTPAPRPPTPVDWAFPTSIDRVPRRWGAILGVFVLALAGVVIATGWYHRLPGLFRTAREMIRARFGW